MSDNKLLAELALAEAFENRWDVLSYALRMRLSGGLKMELGVYKGESLEFISKRVDIVHGFDSFEGLPENWFGPNIKGTFRLDPSEYPPVPPNVQLHVGLFTDTLPQFNAEHAEDIAFVHIDSDLYSSAKTFFDICWPKIVSGTVIVFDEYYNYPTWERGEYKAFGEYLAKNNRRFEYLAYNARGEQVAVRIL